MLSLCALYLIFATGSRASLLGIFAGVAVYIFIVLPPILKKMAIWLSVAGIALFAVLFASKMYSKFWELFLAPQTLHSFHDRLPSNVARANLLKNAWHFLWIHTDSESGQEMYPIILSIMLYMIRTMWQRCITGSLKSLLILACSSCWDICPFMPTLYGCFTSFMKEN